MIVSLFGSMAWYLSGKVKSVSECLKKTARISNNSFGPYTFTACSCFIKFIDNNKPGKPRISYSSYFGTSTSTEKPNVLTAYEHAKMLNDGYELNNSANNLRFSQADLDLLKSKPNESWYDELWKPSNLMRWPAIGKAFLIICLKI